MERFCHTLRSRRRFSVNDTGMNTSPPHTPTPHSNNGASEHAIMGIAAAALLRLVAVLTLLLCGVLAAASAASTTQNVSTSADLLAALQSPTTQQIVLLNDVPMGPEFADYEDARLKITRNITLTGPGGSRSSVDAMPVIDLQNKVGVLELCGTCTFTLAYVSIANENRAGTGGGISAFRGLPGSRVEWVGGVGLRPACPSTASALSLLAITQRSSLFPGKQVVSSTNFTYRGRFYRDMLAVTDLSSDIVPQQMTNSSFTGGIAIRRRNATRLCEHIVSSQCLQRRLPEDCTAELLAGNSSTSSGAAASGSQPNLAVAVAVPVVLGSALVIAVVAAALWWRRRQRNRRRHMMQGGLQAAQGPGGDPAASSDSDGRLMPQDSDTLLMQGRSSTGVPLSPQSSSRTSLLQQQPAVHISGDGSSSGWELLWSSSSPNAERAAQQDDIVLGVLLGAGSFARCYRGRWSGLDVAVKVIHHERDTAQTVAREVQLMLNLNHPNIIRAYHALTRQMRDTAAPPDAGSAGSASPPPPTPGSAPGCIGGPISSALHTPSGSAAAAATRLPSWNPHLKQLQQQQAADVAALPDQAAAGAAAASYVPFVGVRGAAAGSSSQTLDRPSALRQASIASASVLSSTAALIPATPGRTSDLVGGGYWRRAASSTHPGHGSNTAPGVVSSSGLSLLAQDLDTSVLPVYQRRHSYQLLSPLQSAVSGSAGGLSGSVSASTAALHTATAAAAADGVMATTPDAAAPQAGGASGGAASLLPPSPGQHSSLWGSASSPPAAGVPSIEQQQQQLAGAAPLALSAPVGPTTSSGLLNSGSASSSSSRTWHPIMSTTTTTISPGEVQPVAVTAAAAESKYEGEQGAGMQQQLTAGTQSSRRRSALVSQRASEAMCETWLVMELADRGTLARQASGLEPEHNEQDMLCLLHLLRDVACGLKMLQTHNIVHADLNAHNVLVATSPVARHGLVAKLGDFGLSRTLKLHATHRTTGTAGMLSHQPPELLANARMSLAVDIYSFGILMYEVFTRQAAYQGLRVGQIYHQVVVLGNRPVVPPDMPEDYELIMKRCWSSEAGDRPSVDMLLECLDLMIEDRMQAEEEEDHDQQV